LITKKFTYEQIKVKFSDCGVLCPTEEDIKKLQERVLEEYPFPALSKYLKGKAKMKSEEFLGIMKTMGLRDLWLLNSNMKHDESILYVTKALGLFENSKRAFEVNCLLLSGIQPPEISQLIAQRYNESLNTKAIHFYYTMFFNVENMDKQSWIEYLNGESNRTRHFYLLAMNESRERVKHELGYRTRIEYLDALNDVFATAYYKFKDISRSKEGKDITAQRWAETLFEAGDRKEKLQAGDMKDFGEALQMAFVFDEEKFPTYSELSGNGQ